MIQQNAELAALRKLQDATRAYLAVLGELQPALSDNADFLRDLCKAAQMPTEWGTPAAIAMEVEALLDFSK